MFAWLLHSIYWLLKRFFYLYILDMHMMVSEPERVSIIIIMITSVLYIILCLYIYFSG